MGRVWGAGLGLVLLAAAHPILAQPGQATPTGWIEFVARVAPSDGRPEPVRQFTFYLLRTSLAGIRKEVEATEPAADLDKFIDGLEVSTPLKAWMKKQRWVELAGPDFIRLLKADDVLGIPEFREAYMQLNANDIAVGFPKPKFRDADKTRNPEKYAKQKQEYELALRRYLEANPHTLDGIEVHLDAINPGQRWAQGQAEVRRRIRKRTLELAQTRYLVAKTDTDYDGRGMFSALPPGDYWLGTLEQEAVAGDARLHWDVPLTVRSGQATRVELSNLNALEPQRASR